MGKNHQPTVDWRQELKKQLQRIPQDNGLLEIIISGVNNMSQEDAKKHAKELQGALDALPKALRELYAHQIVD